MPRIAPSGSARRSGYAALYVGLMRWKEMN